MHAGMPGQDEGQVHVGGGKATTFPGRCWYTIQVESHIRDG